MEEIRLSALLKADEEKLRETLKADRSIEKSREKSVETLGNELGELLLRYNAACGADRLRQSAADALTASVQDALRLLLAARADRETAPRRVRAGGVLVLLAAVLFAAAAVLLLPAQPLVAAVGAGVAVICAFAAGRLWYGERRVTVRAAVDPDEAWNTFRKTVETMDRKLGEFSAQAAVWEKETRGTGAAAGGLSQEDLKLFGDLLEALYGDNGDFALRQLKKLRSYLRGRGVGLVDYSPEHADLFELFPSRHPGLTQRPALLADKKLLLIGRATEKAD